MTLKYLRRAVPDVIKIIIGDSLLWNMNALINQLKGLTYRVGGIGLIPSDGVILHYIFIILI